MFLVMSMDSGRNTGIGRLAASEATLGIDLIKLALYTPNTLLRTICAGGGFDAFNMTSTPKCSADIRGQRNTRGFDPPAYTRPSGHPARGYLVQGRSPGSRVEAPCPQPSQSFMPQWPEIGQLLAAYSCGGSSGFVAPSWRNAPYSHLSPRPSRIEGTL